MEQNVKKELEDLYSKLSSVKLDNEANQSQVNEAIQAIRAILDEPDSAQRLTLLKRLKNIGLMFDVDHPHLSTAIHKAVDIFVDAGF